MHGLPTIHHINAEEAARWPAPERVETHDQASVHVAHQFDVTAYQPDPDGVRMLVPHSQRGRVFAEGVYGVDQVPAGEIGPRFVVHKHDFERVLEKARAFGIHVNVLGEQA